MTTVYVRFLRLGSVPWCSAVAIGRVSLFVDLTHGHPLVLCIFAGHVKRSSVGVSA
jgi:hypothetical protein